MSYAWAGGAVEILMAERAPVYLEVAEAVATGLGDQSARVIAVEERDGRSAARNEEASPRLIVAVGVRAAQAALEGDPRVPAVATLLPQAAFESLRLGGRRNVTAVFMDQPLTRQFDLLRLAFPSGQRVGVLLGPESARLERAAQTAAAERGFKLVAVRAGGPQDLSAALKEVLGQNVDVLLAIPDPAIWGSGTLQNILRVSVGQRVPLVAFSSAYVKAGALMALQMVPTRIGAQVAQAGRAMLAGKMPPPQYPREFEVKVNRTVMRAMGLDLPDDATLTEQLMRMEERR